MNRELFVEGIPAPQGSKKHVGHGRMREMSKRLDPWRRTIADAVTSAGWHNEPILVAPVGVSLLFTMPRPVYHYGTGRNANTLKDNAPQWCSKQVGDIDKLCRAVLDALTKAGAWRDDSQVVLLNASRKYGPPGVAITVWEVAP